MSSSPSDEARLALLSATERNVSNFPRLKWQCRRVISRCKKKKGHQTDWSSDYFYLVATLEFVRFVSVAKKQQPNNPVEFCLEMMAIMRAVLAYTHLGCVDKVFWIHERHKNVHFFDRLSPALITVTHKPSHLS